MITVLAEFKKLPPEQQLNELEYLAKLIELTYRYNINTSALEQQIKKLEHYLVLGYSELDESVKL